MNGAGKTINRVHNRVHDIASQRLYVFYAKRLDPGGFYRRTTFILDTPPEDVVLAPCADRNHRPHFMVVGRHRHQRSPYHVENRKIIGLIQRRHTRAFGRAQSPKHRRWICDGPSRHLSCRTMAWILVDDVAAIGKKSFQIKTGWLCSKVERRDIRCWLRLSLAAAPGSGHLGSRENYWRPNNRSVSAWPVAAS